MATFKINVVTPKMLVLDTEAEYVKLRTVTGDLGIMAGHVPFVSEVVPGELSIRNGKDTQYYYISWGFLEVSDNVLTVLVDEVSDISTLDETQSQNRADELLQEMHDMTAKGIRQDDVNMKIASKAYQEEKAKVLVSSKHATKDLFA